MLAFLASMGQGKPAWVSSALREQSYPPSVFATGFASEHLAANAKVDAAAERLKRDAQKKLSESIRLKIVSSTRIGDRSRSVNGKEQLLSTYESEIKTSSNADIVGIKTESYYDHLERVVYAFAYANKYELAGYYKAHIGMLLQQAEGALQTAAQLEANREKAKARAECERSISLLAKARVAQDLLTAVAAADAEDLQQQKSELLLSQATQAMARLAQGVYVFVKSSENLFGKQVDIIANKLKAMLASNGCSFTATPEQADLVLQLTANARSIGSPSDGGMAFCYADVTVDLFSNAKNKTLFNDEFSQKGGGASPERAGRKAFEDAAPQLAERLMQWIKN